MNDETDRKVPALTSGGTIRAIIPQNFDEAWRIGKAVCVAGMAPKGLDTPEKATVAILHGMEIGLSPMIALQSIAIINGRPTLYGDTVLGLIQASGKLEAMKEWIEGQGDNRVAVCSVTRRGDPEPKVGSFSVVDAKQAKLWGKQGPWQEYPARMMKMRARSLALRDGFADVLRGMAIAEELRDAIEHNPDERPTPPTPPVKAIIEEKKDRIKPLPLPQTHAGLTPPTPPKPPLKRAKDLPPEAAPPYAEPEPENPAIYDPETGEVFEEESEAAEPAFAGDLLTGLDIALDAATTPEQVEEIWNDHDLMSALEGVQGGDQFQGVALGIKRRHLKRVGE